MKENELFKLCWQYNEKFINDIAKARLDLGLSRFFDDLEDFDKHDRPYSNLKAAKILGGKPGLFRVRHEFITQKEFDDKVDKFLLQYRKHFSPTPQNRRIIKDLFLFGKADFSNDESWPPLNFEANLINRKGRLYFVITKKVRRDDFISNWSKNEKIINTSRPFLKKSSSDKMIDLKMNRKQNIIKLYVYSDTNKVDIKNNWPEINKFQKELTGYKEKSKTSNIDNIYEVDRFDREDKWVPDPMEEKGGYIMDDSDLAEKIYKSGKQRYINRVRQVRRELKKIKRGE